jgi:hypothetical protein
MRTDRVTQMSCAITRADLQRLEDIASSDDLTVTQLVRWALNDWLDGMGYESLQEINSRRGRPKRTLSRMGE